MSLTDELARRMIARRAELLDRMETLDAELDSHDSKDWEDLATERGADEALESLGQSAMAEIARIDAALHRVAEGEYGACVKCGAEIETERLQTVPETPFCAACARKVQAKGSAG